MTPPSSSWPSPVQGLSHKESEEILDNLSDLLRTSELGELQDFRIAGFRLGLDVSSHLKEMLGVGFPSRIWLGVLDILGGT